MLIEQSSLPKGSLEEHIFGQEALKNYRLVQVGESANHAPRQRADRNRKMATANGKA